MIGWMAVGIILVVLLTAYADWADSRDLKRTGSPHLCKGHVCIMQDTIDRSRPPTLIPRA